MSEMLLFGIETFQTKNLSVLKKQNKTKQNKQNKTKQTNKQTNKTKQKTTTTKKKNGWNNDSSEYRSAPLYTDLV